MPKVKRLSLKRPRDRQVLYTFTPNVDQGIVDVVKYVYFKSATYEEVTGEPSAYAIPFDDQWGVFDYDYRRDWRLTGRTSSELLEQIVNHDGEFKYVGACRDFDTAYDSLRRQLTDHVDHCRQRYTDALHKFYKLRKLERPPA